MKRTVARLTLLAGLVGIAVSGSVTLASSFSDSTTATGSITGGTLNLQVSDPDQDFADNLAQHTWVLTNQLPGDSPVCSNINLRNAGNRRGNTVSISVANSGSGGTLMASNIIATLMTYTGAAIVLPQIDPSGDGDPASVSMRDFELDTLAGLPGLNGTPPNGTRSFTLCLQLDANAPPSLMGLSWLGTFTFTLLQ